MEKGLKFRQRGIKINVVPFKQLAYEYRHPVCVYSNGMRKKSNPLFALLYGNLHIS